MYRWKTVPAFGIACVAVFALGAATASAQARSPQQATGPQGAASPPAARPGQRRGGGGGGRIYPASDAASIERGHNQFLSTCAFCHGSNAKGGESGPDLVRSVLVLDDEHGDKIGPVILNGRPDKGMPKFNLTPAQISDISAFLLDRVKAAALRGTYQILNIVTGDPKAGAAYFNGAGECHTCHSTSGDLAHIAAKYDAVTIQQKIVMPRQGRRGPESAPDSAPIAATVAPASGEAVTGTLQHVDDFTVSLTDAFGDLRTFTRRGDDPKVVLNDPLKKHIELLMKYTDSDIHNLTAYLVTLK